MAALKEEWWILQLHTLLRKLIQQYNVWKVFACQAIGRTSNSHIARRSVIPSSRCTLFRAIEVQSKQEGKESLCTDVHMRYIQGSTSEVDQNTIS